MPRYKFTNKASGEEVQFDWNGTKPPGPADIDRISEEQRQSRLKVKTQNAALDEKSTVDKIMTSDVMGGVLKGADWLGLNQPWHPLDSMSEIGAGAKQIFSGEPTPGTPEANPRTAGLNRAVKGTMGLVGPPLTATGYALNPLGTAAGMVAGHAASTGMGAVIPDDTSPEVRELSQSAAGLVGGALAGGMASRSKFGGTSASTPTVGPNPGTAVGRPIYGQRQPPPRGNGATIMNMGPRQLPAAGPANAGVMPQIAPPVEAPPPVEALTPEVLPPFNYQAGRGAIAPAPSMAQLPTRGTAIPMPPASIPVPEAGTYGRQQITEQAFGSAPRQIEAPQISAPGERPLAPEPKGAADLTPAPTITPEVAAPEVRSQGERTPAPAAPQPRRVVQDIDRNETLKPEIASTLGVGSTRINSKGGVETLQDVPIELVDPTPGNELYPEGNKLYPDKVQEYVNKPSNVAVELRNRNGRFETYEGHHRVEAAKQRGDKSVLAWTSDTGPDNLPLPRAVSEAPPAAPGVPEQPQVRSPEDIARSAIAQASAKPPEVVPPAEVSPAQTELARLQAENVRLKAGKNETIESTVEPAVSIPPQEAKAPVEPKVDSPQNVASAAIRRASEPTGPKVQNPEDYSVAPNQKAEIQMKNKVLDFVKRRVGITPAQIQTEFGLPGTVVDTILADFKGRGLVTVKGGKYNYVKMRGEEISEPVVEPVVKPPTVKAPENILPEPSVKSPIVRPPLAAGRPQSAQNGQDSAAISAKPAISEQKIEGQKTESSGDLVTRLKGGSKKSQQIATELENHTRRLDELETKEDSPEGLTREETNERDTLYSKINKLERDGEYQLKPDIEKYGPRVANMRSIHAEGALSGLSHEQISTRAKAEYGVESMSKMTHEQLAEFEESLRTERMEEETRLIDEDEAEFDSAGKKKAQK